MEWGWRIPYLSAIFPGALVVIGRKWLTESEEFVESKNQGVPGVGMEEGDSEVGKCKGESAPIWEVLTDYWPQLLVGTLGTAGCGAIWYVPPVYGVQFIQTYDGLPPSAVTLSEMVVYLIPTVLSPAVGTLVDVCGAGRVYLLAMAAGCVVAPLPLFYWWTHVPVSDAGNKVLDPRGPVSAPAAYMLAVGMVSVLTVLVSRLMGSRGVLKISHIRASPY